MSVKTDSTQSHWCGLRVVQSRAPLKPDWQAGGSDDFARATLLDLTDLSATGPRPLGQPRRADLWPLVWLVGLSVPWLLGLASIVQWVGWLVRGG